MFGSRNRLISLRNSQKVIAEFSKNYRGIPRGLGILFVEIVRTIQKLFLGVIFLKIAQLLPRIKFGIFQLFSHVFICETE
jgi:hypothetical protein